MGVAGTAVQAQEWTVTVASDDVTDPGSLRYAVVNAQAGDIITFDLHYPATITLNEVILIDKDLTIQGPGEDLLTISGGGSCQVFWANSNFSEPIISISQMTIADGYADYGGGIAKYSADLTVENVIFLNNTATWSGGGVYDADRVVNCTFISNTAGIYGGGMYNEDNSVVVNGSTFMNNAAASRGGGICNNNAYYNESTTVVVNCSFTGNTATELGGGIYYSGDSRSDISVVSCTFTGNSAGTDGGGMYKISDNSFSIANCIFWGNSGGDIYDLNPNGNYAHCVISHDNPGYYGYNNINTDPLLQELADNGGPTQTCALGLGSSAINAGIAVDGVSADQRGASRPFGGSFDIGAYESGIEVYEITATCSDRGTISPTKAYTLAGIEDEVFYLMPDEGYVIQTVRVDNVPDSYDESRNTYTFENVSADHSISVTFAIDTCTMTLSPGNHGDITGDTTVGYGTSHTYTITPDTGYEVADVTLDGISRGAVTSLTVNNIVANRTIAATFRIDTGMIGRSGLDEFRVTPISAEQLQGLAESVDLPGQMTPASLDVVSEDLVMTITMEDVVSGDVDTAIESRDGDEEFLQGVSFDITYSSGEVEIGLLPLEIDMKISRNKLGQAYCEAIDMESQEKGLNVSFFDHVGILKIINPGTYDLLEVAWESYFEAEAKGFFEVSTDVYNYYVGFDLLVADAKADSADLAVQAVADSPDHYFLVFDGELDGHFSDPLVAVKKPLAQGGSRDGCNIGYFPASGLALIFLPLLVLLKKK